MRAARFFAVMPLLLCLSSAVAARESELDRQALPPSATALAKRLETVLASPALRGARVAALVVRERDGAPLFEHAPDKALIPASNMKILTAMAALATFGPTHRFETAVLADREPDATGSIGELVVRGSGDPALNSEDWWMLASALRRRGVQRIEGDLVMDDSAFDATRWHADWGQVSSRAYHAPVGALTANYGSFGVTVRAGASPGDPVRVDVEPPIPYLHVKNMARTVPARSRNGLVVDRRRARDSELVVVAGAVHAGDEARTFYRSVRDPARYAGAVLRMQLLANGIEVEGKVRVDRAPEGAHELLVHEGRSLAEIVRLFMKYSNNTVAESLVKAMGRNGNGETGSWQAGLPVLEARLGELGVDVSALKLSDGSGLSYQNRVSPRALVAALRAAQHSFGFGPELLASLPIAARDGTLEKRAGAASDAVRAKTGLLNQVSALSGLAMLGGRPGDVAVFSILVNDYKVNDEAVMDALDRFAAELVRPALPPTKTSGSSGAGQPGRRPS